MMDREFLKTLRIPMSVFSKAKEESDTAAKEANNPAYMVENAIANASDILKRANDAISKAHSA